MRAAPIEWSSVIAFILVGSLLGLTGPASAAPVTMTFTTTSSSTSVADAGGSWQFDGGTVSMGPSVIGHFARVKRIVTGGGTDTQNTATLTITIFLFGSDPPETLTLEGAHSFTNGQERGSISGASAALAGSVGVTFQGPSTALTLNYP